MRTYSEREVFDRDDLATYRLAERFVRLAPSVDRDGKELRCHEMARAVAMFAQLPPDSVRDGYYELGCQHSWIVLPSRHVLDAYAVGRHPPVQLVAVVTTIPKRFVERDLGIAVDQETVDWLLSETSMRHSQCWDSDREGA